MNTRFRFHKGITTVTALVLTLAPLLLAGCRSTKGPGSASFASVEISGCTAVQIRDVTMQVFREDGYLAWDIAPGELLFEKEGTRMNQLAYAA